MSGHCYGLQTDGDDRRRSCTVTLYRRPIAGPLGFHWALHFDFGDYDAFYEANDEGGRLMPNWGRGKPLLDVNPWTMDVGKKIVSPKQVNDCAKNNKYNGKVYVLTKMNCQVWAQQLASDLGLSIPITCNIIGFVPVVSEVIDIFNFAVGSSRKK